MASAKACADCNVEMELGFVPDHYAQIIQSHWHPGTATEKTFTGNLKLNKEDMVPITAYRCPQCGLLKHYASR
jgi:Domain of unknown function (DUF6487)